MKPTACDGCGAVFGPGDGPTHPYIESSPACWAAFGAVVAREFADPTWFAVHQLTVDSYAVQHPGRPSPRSLRSVGLHLIGLFTVLEVGLEPHQATKAIQSAARDRSRFDWLEPPADRGSITVADVIRAGSAAEHARVVRDWAESTWRAWSPHHATIRTWARVSSLPRRPGPP